MYKTEWSRLAVSLTVFFLLASLVGQTAAVGLTSEGVQSDVQSIPACVGDLPRVDAVGNQSYGGDDDDNIFDATRTANQTLLAGSTKSYNGEPELREETNYDGWVVALHPNGTERWNESYGDDSGHSGYAITSGADTGALLLGTANEQDTSETDGWAVRISDNGSEVWNRTFGDSGEYDRVFDAAPAPGGGFYIVGETTSVADNRFESQHSDAWLIEVNESGSVVHERVIGGYNATYGKSDSFTGIQKTTDGYLVWGQTESLTPKTYAAAWLLKLNQSGQEKWNHTYANGRDRSINDVSQQGEDEVVVVGQSGETDSEGAWIAALGANGELRWDRTYGESVDRFESIAGVDQSGYLVSGSTWTCSSDDSYADFSLTKIRPNTSVKWTSQYGGPRADQTYATASPRTGRLLLVGSTSSFGDNGWVVEVPVDPELLPLGPSYHPPRDPDLDGLFEDVNGDGSATFADVQALFARIDSISASDAPYFDYNDDGNLDLADVQTLFIQLS